MALDIAALIEPLSDEAPSGPDLSYDDARIEIEAAFERPVSEDGGAADIDWRKVIDQILAQAGQTRDIWLPVYLMRAAAASGRFDVLVDAAQLLAGLLEERWADVHPQLDEYGFIGRKTPCESLTRIPDFLAPLARVPLIEHPRFGRFSCSDFERFADEGASAEGYGQFRAALETVSPDDAARLAAQFDALITAFRRTDGVLTANAEGDTATNFKPTYDKLDRYRAAMAKLLPGLDAATSEAHGAADDAGADAAASPVATQHAAAQAAIGQGFTGAIRNRDDVVRALDAICTYYAAAEPGSPVPLLLRRARDWTSLDFMTVLEDLVPDSVDEAARILRSRRPAAVEAVASAEAEAWDGGQTSSEW